MGKGVQSLLFTLGPPDFLVVLCDTATFEMLFADPQRRFDLASGKKAPVHFLRRFAAEILTWATFTWRVGWAERKDTYQDTRLRADGIPELHRHDTVRLFLLADGEKRM
jgi:hypothetical protein